MGQMNANEFPGFDQAEARDGVKLLKGKLDLRGETSSGKADPLCTFDLREFHNSRTGKYGEIPEYLKSKK